MTKKIGLFPLSPKQNPHQFTEHNAPPTDLDFPAVMQVPPFLREDGVSSVAVIRAGPDTRANPKPDSIFTFHTIFTPNLRLRLRHFSVFW